MNPTQLESRGALSPFQNEFNRMLSAFNRWHDGSENALAWAPSIDVKEEPTRFVITADLPGVDAKDIDVSMDRGALTITGKRQSEKKEEKDGYLRTERSSGEFFRRLVLPDTADAENISAKTDKGVLEVTIPKREAAKAKRIEVKA
jgi:HSP20 family protein